MNKPIAIVLIIFLILFLVSCYTTFKHPQVYTYSDSTDVYQSQQISFIDDCSSCHQPSNPMNDAHQQVYNYPLYEENYNWQYFYVIPWWADEYYYQNQRSTSEETLAPTQRRDFDRRDQAATSANPSSGVSGATLSKPTSTGEASSATSPQTEHPKRSERRDTINRDDSKSQQPTTPAPTRTKKEAEDAKNKQKQEKE